MPVKRNLSKGEELVKVYEGFRDTAYLCPAGVWTIGFGSTAGVKKGDTITRKEAEALFSKEFSEFAKQVEKLAGKNTTDNELAAMTSLAYNIGIGDKKLGTGFAASSVLKYHLAGDKAKAAACFGLWNKATVNGKKIILKGLVRRREAESKLYKGEL